MRSNLSYQHIIDCYKWLYVSLMVTTKQKSSIDTQKRKWNLSIPLKKIIKSQRKRARDKETNYKTASEQY